MLERLVYVSTAARRQDLAGQAAAIAEEARTRNLEKGIGGALVAHDGHFVQALEGERPGLDQLLKRLEDDPRHYDLVLVDRWRVEERLFAGWAMAGVAMDAATRAGLDALIADRTLDPRPLVETLRGRAVPMSGTATYSAAAE
ncbi:MAG: BLUF domain-containing protein [Brevundimonas sp.]|uniref:BLUF domain-containing protein n=1 Tax=Brevundimonas sp. TaxID=1871086 RepID=UPI002630F37F|nr:BLUF domain-containing protein [Brevundimonas sp.]MDI6624763.1 BLUF domain-containing protein [Brevundimonas sp.]MDQ7813901.1 BLUF domain-containing protein [Brevundimonas sp.]